MSVKERIALLKSMNMIILNENDEDVMDYWFSVGIPDNPSEEDYEIIAEDNDDFLSICKKFMFFMRDKDNKLFIGNINGKMVVV